MTNISAARIHNYGSPLVLEDIHKPTVSSPEEVLVRVGAAGLCHSDLHLINGDWKRSLPLNLPKTPGHEICGWVEETGSLVPEQGVRKGDLVAVFGGWGCGSCVYCKRGDEQMCIAPTWPGLSQYDGGFAEYLLVPSYRFLVKIGKESTLSPEEVAPLTDAGLTPYRAIKKVRHLLVPGKNIAIIGIGGLGSYALQYAKMLGSGANVVALDRRDDKLQLATDLGVDSIISIEKSVDISGLVKSTTRGNGFDVVLDTVGTESTLSVAIRMLNRGGALAVIGLFGQKILLPLFETVIKEYQVYGSLWGNYNELREVLELAKKGLIKHHVQKFSLSKVNDAIELLRDGNILGRAVIVP
ncbi:MAG: NAD(P)-dependent alcohol dehydrogenase [Candidatus Eiseniibacteriota bacterium]